MVIFEVVFEILAVLACFVIGAGIIYAGVYNCIIVPQIPKSKNWVKTRGRIVGKNDYIEKSRRNKYDFRSGFSYSRKREKIIEYTVDGRVYRKSVPDSVKGASHIYYRKSSPDYFKTVYEIKHSNGGTVLLILCFIFGAGFMTMGVFCLLEILEKIFG